MFKMFYPHEYIKNVFCIDYEKLYNMGYRGIIFDIDNTLVHHGEDCTKEVEKLFQTIHGIGLKTILLSDGGETRIKRFAKRINTLYIHDANKPSVVNCLKAVEMLNIKKEEVTVIGDQILRDIYGANKSGIVSILVEYMRYENEKKIGIRRNIENVILKLYKFNKRYHNRIGDIYKKERFKIPQRKRKLFCDINPTCYAISLRKEICKRHLKNLFRKENYAKIISNEKLPVIISAHSSHMIKRGKGINLEHQKNKAVNIEIAGSKITGIIIRPGEVFSFWNTVGKITRKKGYLDGRVLLRGNLTYGIGGGLCNLANTIHLLVLHSPLDIIEVHNHSDALAPDEGERIPYSAGTAIDYNNIDFRFKNNTAQCFQLLLWCEDETSYAELRSEKEFPERYKLIEENHHFRRDENKYYRISKIYKATFADMDNILKKELVWDNCSEVFYDYALIPQDQIKE
ncbi:MAG: YqeG family HAD IIIA-type phosphatase [Oscillospiraceae bacterium]|nr:YqeG family HAD IIIA-type phosphatase [Oscillospiraceae bacterium]